MQEDDHVCRHAWHRLRTGPIHRDLDWNLLLGVQCQRPGRWRVDHFGSRGSNGHHLATESLVQGRDFDINWLAWTNLKNPRSLTLATTQRSFRSVTAIMGSPVITVSPTVTQRAVTCPATGLGEQGRDNPNGGRFARAVRPQESEEFSFLDIARLTLIFRTRILLIVW